MPEWIRLPLTLSALAVLADCLAGAAFIIRGRVVMSDGSRPPADVYVERVCVDVTRREATVDSEGRFSFQLSTDSLNYRTGMQALDTCLVRAVLGGYRSTAASLASRIDPRLADTNVNLGTLVLRPEAQPPGALVSARSLAAPKPARQAYERALKAIGQRRWDEARKQLETATREYPDYAEAWYSVGVLSEQRGDLPAAREAYTRAGGADPQSVQPYLRLGELAARQRDWKEAAGAARIGIGRDPVHWPALHVLHAVASFNLGDLEGAEQSARAAARLDPGHKFPKAVHILGLVALERQDYSAARTHLRAYLEMAPHNTDAEAVREQLAAIDSRSRNPGK
ncbi:MAG: tetratricopeptide repeat protein [Bryobacterales bacterium]|nr:tetratricopeptide repeat protein [Bryobacterales bacterium]